MVDYRKARGVLRPAEREVLFSLASLAPLAAVILNVGVQFGASLVCLHQGAPEALVVGVDVDMSPYLYADEVPGVLLEQDSRELVEDWPFGSIAVAFIDGGHGYECVRSDAGFADFVSVGGFVAFHDCYDWVEAPRVVRPGCPGVNLAVQEWHEGNGEEWYELPEVDSIRLFERIQQKGGGEDRGWSGRGLVC